MSVTARFVRGMIEAMGCDPAIVERPGVTVAGDPGRAENHVTAGYRFGAHLVITCDPAVETMLRRETAALEPTLQAWQSAAAGLGGELLGSGRMQVLPEEFQPARGLPEGFALRRLDRAAPDHVSLIARFADRCSPDDIEMIELELDDLGSTIVGVTDAEGELVAYAEAKPWPMVAGFDDIGILTAADQRGKGLGAAAVDELARLLRAGGTEPLYRCDEDNTASVELSAGLGFEVATMLVAFRFPSSPPFC